MANLPDFTTQDAASYKASIDSACSQSEIIHISGSAGGVYSVDGITGYVDLQRVSITIPANHLPYLYIARYYFADTDLKLRIQGWSTSTWVSADNSGQETPDQAVWMTSDDGSFSAVAAWNWALIVQAYSSNSPLGSPLPATANSDGWQFVLYTVDQG